jgi:hypothetical protein
VGRLLQAGWLSPTKTKSAAIEKALSFALPVRNIFIKATEKSKPKVPKIIADFFVMTLSEISFSSVFLSKEISSVFERLSSSSTLDNMYRMLCLLSANHRFLDKKQVAEAIDKSLGVLGSVPNLSIEEQVRALLLLMIMERENKPLADSLRRRLKKLEKRYPETFKALLPHKRKGFRR